MDEREQFIKLLSESAPVQSDVIVLLAGDRFYRVPKVAELYHAGHAPQVVLTSSADNWEYGSAPSSKLVPELLALGVNEQDIIWEETAPHTRAEADATLRLANSHGWKKLLLVTTEYHQYRAFLTWFKAIRDTASEIDIAMAPVSGYPDFHGETRDEGLTREFERIDEYQKKGDVASFQEGVVYLSEKKNYVRIES